MAYCRNCRAQLKTAQICPVCGTERIPSKKRLLGRKKLPLPDAKNGAESLRAGLREGSTLLLLIAGLALLGSAISLTGNLHLIPQGNIMAMGAAASAVISLLMPAGLLLLWREKEKEGEFSQLGFRLIMGHQIWGMAYLVVLWLYLTFLPRLDGEVNFFWELKDLFARGFWDLGIMYLLLLLVISAVFGVLILWEIAGIRLCKNARQLINENKRFYIPKYFEIGLLIMGAISVYAPFQNATGVFSGLLSMLTAAGYLLKYALLVKVKKHI